MNLKKIALSASALALAGGFALAPAAMADDQLPANDVVQVDGAQEGNGGYVVVRGQGALVGPLEDGYIGVSGTADNTDGPTLHGSCEDDIDHEADGAGKYSDIDLAGGNTSACSEL